MNLRRHTSTDLQSVAFDRSAIPPDTHYVFTPKLSGSQGVIPKNISTQKRVCKKCLRGNHTGTSYVKTAEVIKKGCEHYCEIKLILGNKNPSLRAISILSIPQRMLKIRPIGINITPCFPKVIFIGMDIDTTADCCRINVLYRAPLK